MGVDFSRVRTGEQVATLGAAIGIVASFLPWATLSATSPGVIYGYDGPGTSGLIGGFIPGTMMIQDEYTPRSRRVALFISIGVLGLAILGLAILGLIDPTLFYARGPFAPTPSIGTFVGIIGGALACTGTIMTDPV